MEILMIKCIDFKFLPIVFLIILFGCGGGDSSSSKGESNGGVDGKGGSMSRFSLIGDYLYAISGRNLQIFKIAVQGAPSQPAVAVPEFKVSVAWGIETLYNSDGHLFIGAANGVYIFDNKDPRNPTQVSKFLHVRSCDPVVVNGKYAYVTLSTGGRCGPGQSQMDVLDLNDITKPVLVKSYNMQNPKGLGVGNNLLFVCDDIAGLKVYNVANPKDPIYMKTDTSIKCYDLIPYQNRLVISDNSGILQYSYSGNSESLNKISEIKVNTP